MSLKQCSAIKPSGERCKRVAAEGSDYCHSHRGYQPKVREPLPLGNRLVEHLFDCTDCKRLIPVGERQYTNLDTGVILCEPCHRLRRQIEDALMEVLDSAPNQTLQTASSTQP